MDEEIDHSTLFYTDDHASLLGKDQRLQSGLQSGVQQSFIFGADQFSLSTLSQRDTPSGERSVEKASRKRSHTETQWALVVRHWFLSMVLLPAYVLALVTYAWKTSNRLSRSQGALIFIFSLLFYGLIWASFALLLVSPSVRLIFPPQSAAFVYFLYCMSCFAESTLKNTCIIDASATSFTVEEGNNQRLPAVNTENLTTRDGKTWTTARFLETIFFIAKPTPAKEWSVRVATLLVSLVYTGFVLALHCYFFVSAKNFESSVIAYSVIMTILQGTLCFVILYPLSQVALRLHTRGIIARLFSDATQVESSLEHSFALTTLENVQAWQSVRDTLIRKYAFPTLYVDVVISAAFTLWVPLVAVGVMDFLFRSAISSLALTTTALAVLILGYLLVCVILASRVQETLADTDVLRWQEYSFLVGNSASHAEVLHLTRVLKRLAQLIDSSKEEAVVFTVWSLPLNRRMATVLGGILVTLSSSVLVRAASKVAIF